MVLMLLNQTDCIILPPEMINAFPNSASMTNQLLSSDPHFQDSLLVLNRKNNYSN